MVREDGANRLVNSLYILYGGLSSQVLTNSRKGYSVSVKWIRGVGSDALDDKEIPGIYLLRHLWKDYLLSIR